MNQKHLVFIKYRRQYLHEVTDFSLNYLCRVATGRTALSRSFINQVCFALNEPEEELFSHNHPGGQCLQPGDCAANAFGQWIEDKCKNDHPSLREIAHKVGVSHQTIAGLKAGKRPLPETIEKLARAFGGKRWLALQNYLLVLAGYKAEDSSQPDLLEKASLLSPQHQRILEVLVEEFTKIEGSK